MSDLTHNELLEEIDHHLQHYPKDEIGLALRAVVEDSLKVLLNVPDDNTEYWKGVRGQCKANLRLIEKELK